jgi:hypothetical protein
MHAIFRITAAFGLLLGASLVVSACGGGGLTLEEYFDKLEEIDADAGERLDEIGNDISDAEDLDEVKDLVDDFSEALEDYVGGLEDLKPPGDAEDAHEDYVAAANEALDEWDKFRDDVQDADTIDELSLLDTAGVDDAADRVTAVCLDLQEIADDNDIDVSLDCEN